MKMFAYTKPAFSIPAHIAAILILSLVLWTTGLPGWMHSANAAALSNVSDVIYDSDLGVLTSHRLTFTTNAALDADDTIVVTFDPTGTSVTPDEFTVNNLGAADFVSESGIDVVASCGAGGNEATVSTTTETVTLTVCTGDTVSAGAITFQMGATSTPKITNPNVEGSNVVRIETKDEGATTIDNADARVYIINNVVVTASVDSVFTFEINGTTTGRIVNGTTTNIDTSGSDQSIPFSTLAPGVPKIAAQDIAVVTNAANGFSVTVRQDQNLTSSAGADIDLFIDGATTSVPVAWQSPANTFNQENTYGHFGITSSDSVTSSSTNPDEWGTNLWAGNIDQPREILYHNAPSSGFEATDGEGWATIGYQVEIGTLQEAATDYTNTLTYVATPVF